MFKLVNLTRKVCILILLVSACSAQKDTAQNKANPLLKLSTEQQDTRLENAEPNHEHPATDLEKAQNEEKSEQSMQEEEITEGQPNRPNTEIEPENNETENETEQKRLPFQEFKERWNAISDEQMTELYISQFDEHKEQDGMIYSSHLNKDHSLRIHVQDGSIRQIEMMTNHPSSSSTVFSMLSGWGQLIHILHPNIEIYDVDTFFNQMGVGPNADLTNVKHTSIIYGDIKYTIIRINQGYLFKAAITSEKKS